MGQSVSHGMGGRLAGAHHRGDMSAAPHGPHRARTSVRAGIKTQRVLTPWPAGGITFFFFIKRKRLLWVFAIAIHSLPTGKVVCIAGSPLLYPLLISSNQWRGTQGGYSPGLCSGSGMHRTMRFYPWVCLARANSKISFHAWSACQLSSGRAEVREV